MDKLVNEVGMTRSKADPCLFYRGQTIYIIYTDDSIVAGPNIDEIDTLIADIRKAKLEITEEGDIADFLGIHINRREDGTIHLHQPHLIDQILEDLSMNQPNLEPKDTPAKSSRILLRHPKSKSYDKSFSYRSIIGKLGYLETGSRMDIGYIAHQCARFSSDPKVEHAAAIRHVARYLAGTRDKGLILRPDSSKGLEVYVDADFAGN